MPGTSIENNPKQKQLLLRVSLHVIFWCCSFLVLLYMFSYGEKPRRVDVLYDFLFHIFLLILVYVNLYIAFPANKKTKSWLWYILLISGLIAGLAWLNMKFFNDWSASIFPGFYFISYFTWREIAAIFFIYLSVTSLLKLSKSWFAVNELEKKLLQAETEKIQLELAALKSQVNPHFFFNTLNGLYALSFKNNPVLASSILQLSDLMRYFIYESKAETVALEKEIKMMSDYIALMKIRVDDQADIQFQVQGEQEGKKIAPLLFISFLENAFKHGVQGSAGKTFIHLNIVIEQQKLLLQIENNKGKSVDAGLKQEGGFGLKNVKRRLTLLYPGEHELKLKETEDIFKAELQIFRL